MTPHPVADQASFPHAAEFFNSLLVLLSQSVAAFAEKNHIFEKTHFSACGGLRWVWQDRGTWRRGFLHMLRVLRA